MPFDEIAPIVGRSPAAARQLASRARRRVRGAPAADADLARQREVVDAFLAAARDGDFDALLAVLDPDVVFRSTTARREPRARAAVARRRRGRAAGARARPPLAALARPALVNGAAGASSAARGRSRSWLHRRGGRIVALDLIIDRDKLRGVSERAGSGPEA